MGKKTIFLVDDALTNLTVGHSALEPFYNVVTISSGERLLKILERRVPDLVLLDIDMPEMNGYEALAQIRANEKLESLPVIFLTSYSDSVSELKGLSLGAVDYIAKPFSPPLLLKRIELHLLIQDQRRQLIRFNENLQQMVNEKTKNVVELKNAVLLTISELLGFRDNYTGVHIYRTQVYLKILIRALQKSGLYLDEIADWDIEIVLQSAQLHDVGKIAVDDCILRKPGKLTEQEYEKIKEHCLVGEKIIERAKAVTGSQADFLEQARILAGGHHERWDGSGYPRGLSGQQIPLQCRLMAIVDVYDALVSQRPYKAPMPHPQAVNAIREGAGTLFDPALVDLFLSVSDDFDTLHEFEPQPQLSGS